MVDGKMVENDEAILNLPALNYVGGGKKKIISLTYADHVVLFLVLQLRVQ
jgi:hypothetical protein